MSEGFGFELRRWREVRGMSQVELARFAGVSQRHVSFLETGRSRPSREMVMRLCAALDVPRDECALILGTAEFDAAAPAPDRHDGIEQAVEAVLTRHEPWAAVAVDARWNVVRTNGGFVALLALAFPDGSPWRDEGNLLRLLLHPEGLVGAFSAPDRARTAWTAILASSSVEHPHDLGLAVLASEVAPGLARSPMAPHRLNIAIPPLSLRRDGTDIELLTMVTGISGDDVGTEPGRRIVTFVPDGEVAQRAWSVLVRRG